MSYYTHYMLTISIREVGDKTLHDEAKKVIESKLNSWGLKKQGSYVFSSIGGCKWYDHEYEIANISRKFPTVLFVLEGQGERRDDLWRKYFRGGKVRRIKPELVWPDPDSTSWESVGGDDEE